MFHGSFGLLVSITLEEIHGSDHIIYVIHPADSGILADWADCVERYGDIESRAFQSLTTSPP